VYMNDTGISGKIIMCMSSINYHEKLFPDYVEQFAFMNKPIKTDELRSILDECEVLKTKKVPKLEIRTKEETLYVNYEDFVYANALVPGKTSIVLVGGKEVLYYKDINLVKSAIRDYPFMVPVNLETIVSVYHVAKIKKFSVEMDEGSVFKIPMKMAKTVVQELEKAKKSVTYT